MLLFNRLPALDFNLQSIQLTLLHSDLLVQARDEKIPAQPRNNDPKDREDTQLSVPGDVVQTLQIQIKGHKKETAVRSQEAESLGAAMLPSKVIENEYLLSSS